MNDKRAMPLWSIILFTSAILLTSCLQSNQEDFKSHHMDALNLVEKSKGFIEAFESRDVDKMKSYFSGAQTIYRLPYATGMMPSDYEGAEAFHEFTKDLPELFEHIELDIVEIILDEAARKVVARTEIKLHVADYGPYENAQVFILRFNESGELEEVSEYFNAVPTAIGMRKFGTHDRLLDSLKIDN